jgi:hypothetical protein
METARVDAEIVSEPASLLLLEVELMETPEAIIAARAAATSLLLLEVELMETNRCIV